MSTITLDDLQREPGKWAQLAADSGETVLVTKAGQPLVSITPATTPAVRRDAQLPDREEEIARMTPLTDSTEILAEIRADRDL